jgi:hypothetical protein
MDNDQANNEKVIQFPTAKQDEGGGSGEFFTFDRRSFAAACRLGLNPAVAYLTIARGAGSRSKSAWSIDAIERHTGMGRAMAKKAVKTLIDAGLLTLERGGTRPRYGIVPAHLLPGAVLSPDERRVFDLVGNKPTRIKAADIRTASQLVRRGLLKEEYRDYSRDPRADDILSDKPLEIWLPNAIVDGAADEDSPLTFLRQMQDIRKLQLFVALYDNSDLPTYAGVDRSMLYQEHTVSKVSQRGALTVWGFDGDGRTFSAGRPPLHDSFLTGANHETRDAALADFWGALGSFQDCGFITFIPYVFESDDPGAGVLHAYPTQDRGCEPWEREVAEAAHAAGIVCIPATQQEWAAQLGRHLLPQPSHISGLTIIGIARLRYRPRTRMTAAWFAMSKERSAKHLQAYQKVAEANKNAGQAAGSNMQHKLT